MIDQIVMLLSTDWFLPYWFLIGFDSEDSAKISIQRDCRDVMKRILGDADEYWLISFSEDRLRDTFASLEFSLDKAGIAKEAWLDLQQWALLSNDQLRLGWYIAYLTEALLSNQLGNDGLLLDPKIKEILLRAQERNADPQISLVELAEESRSSWDSYIKKLTPDQPNYVPEHFQVLIAARSFRSIWKFVQSKLTEAQKRQLIEWYSKVAKTHAHIEISSDYFDKIVT